MIALVSEIPFPPDEWFEQRGVSVDTMQAIRATAPAVVARAPKALPTYAKVELASMLSELPAAA